MQSTFFSHVFINEIVHRTARQKAIIIISYTIQDKQGDVQDESCELCY